MKKKNLIFALLLLFVFIMAVPVKADAAWKVKNGKHYYYNNKKKVTGWFKLGRNKYYFNEKGVMQTGWQTIGKHRYFFSMKKKNYGAMVTGWRAIGKKTYYFTAKGRLRTGWITVNGKNYYISAVKGRATGITEINGKKYIFNSNGVLQKKWSTVNGNRYYGLKATGELVTGIKSISKKKYYFDQNAVLQKNTQITINGQLYKVDSNGICSPVVENTGTAEDMLFFTLYESGSAGYGQVGGDNGNACGKYQFDYRYSLLPFVKYCYSSNPTVFAGFKKYAEMTNTAKNREKLQGNKTFYKAWTAIYETYPTLFKSYQDNYAIQEYYSATETYLMRMGIDISNRPQVVKGAVFSYSIQHGSYTAALAVKAAGLSNTTTNEAFITKLYNYRIKKYPLYKSRYTSEKLDAISRL